MLLPLFCLMAIFCNSNSTDMFFRYLTNDNFFGDTPFGETSDGEIVRDEITLDGSLHDFKADLSRTTVHEDELEMKEKNNLSASQSNLGM